MSVDVFPEFAPPQVVVQTEAPGMAPQDVESLITYPLESAINGTPGVTSVRSKTSVGLSTITVVFKPDTNIYLDRQLVNERIQNIKLPESSRSPVMMPVTSAVGWMVKYALTSDTASLQELRTISEWEIRPRILALGGIASVLSIGGEVKQYQVLLDEERLLAYQISADDVRRTLAATNMNVPGAFLNKPGSEFIISGVGRINTLQELRNTVVTIRNGVPITINNIAKVEFGPEIKRGDAALNMKNAVIGTISKSYGADTLTTTYKVEKTLDEISKQLPPGVKLNRFVFRQANFIESAIHNLNVSLIEGAIIVIAIIFLFLMNIRASFITFLSMPASFVGGILVMYLLGVGINSMTLGGLAIAIGEVVDDGIITVENVVRRLRLNRMSKKPSSSFQVVLDAVQEIRSSVVYATIIISLIFIPIFFLQDIAGRIFTPLGIAYIASVMASLVVSVTTIPALCYLLLVYPKEKKRDEELKNEIVSDSHTDKSMLLENDSSIYKDENPRFVHSLKGHFRRMLNSILDHFWWVVGISLGMLLIALMIIPFLGRSFLPEFHEGNFIISMATLPGTSLDESMRIGSTVRKMALKYPQVISIVQRAGRSELDEDAQPPNYSEFDLTIDFEKNKKMPPEELIKNIRVDLSQIPGVVFNVGQFIAHRMDEVLSGVRAQVAIKIFGENLNKLYQLGLQVQNVLKDIPGVVDIYVEQQIQVPQLIIKIRQDKAARYGIQAGDVLNAIELYLNGKAFSTVLEGRQTFELVARLQAKDRQSFDTIKNLLIDAPGPNNSTIKIPLRQVADISMENAPYVISRESVQRLLIISFNVQGRDLGSVIQDAQAKIAVLKLPPEYYVEYGGQFQSQQEANRILMTFGALAIFATLMLLYKVFGTLREAILVMVNLPLALIGGIFAVVIAGGNLSVASMIGFITLFGIAARNGIILVTHYNQLNAKGKPLRDVVLEGTMDRLLPVLMTASTAALGLIPLLWGSPTGKELQRPLAQVVLGGLVTSTLLNLVVVPTVYYYIELRRQRSIKDLDS